ncbi:MAG: methyltransferase family protein [Promethearchaeota archaeon]
MNYFLFFGTLIILILYGAIIFKKTKTIYDKVDVLPKWLSISWSVMYGIGWFSLILCDIWLIPINIIIAFIFGGVLIVIGIIILFVSMVQFKSISRSFGRDTSQLITGGIYRWSRNPQNLGCFLILFGTSLITKSILAFLLSIVYLIIIHLYIIILEEKYLELIFKEDYVNYKKRTSRYFGIPEKKNILNLEE